MLSPPPKIAIGSHPFPLNLDNMSISEFISELRFTFLPSDFDRVEEALVVRELRLKEEIERNNREIRSLQDIIEVQKVYNISVELELKRLKEEREKKEKKSVHERCETVVKVEENNRPGGLNFDDKAMTMSIVGELRKRNSELEVEKSRFLDLKRKWDADMGIVVELRKRVSELEAEKVVLMAEKKKWVGESCAIDELRDENRRLKEEKLKAEELVRSWEKRYSEFNERFLKCKSGTKKGLVVNGEGGDPGGGGNTRVESSKGKEEKKIIEDFKPSIGAGTWKTPSIPRKKKGVGASAKRRPEMELIIDIEDSDEDACNTQGTSLQRKETPTSRTTAVDKPPSSSEAVKKNLSTGPAAPVGKSSRGFSSPREFVTNKLNGVEDSETSSSSSSSSSGSLDMDSLPLSSLRSNKKMRTESPSLDIWLN